MAEYDSFAPIYDQVMGDAADTIRLLHELMQKHCPHARTNHLTAFSQWESVFEKAAAHLDNGGLFIVDMNTMSKLERLAGAPAWEEGSKIVIKVDKQNGYFVWHIKPKEAADPASGTHILEASFPITDMTSAIEKHFDVVESFEDNRVRPMEKSKRVCFVCKKK